MAGTKSVGTRNAMMAKGITPTWKRSCIDWKHCPFCLLICSQAISCSCSTDQLTKSACFLNSSSSCLVCLHKTSSDQQWSEPIRPSDLIFRRCPARNPSGSVCKTEQYLHDIYMIFTWYLHDIYMIFTWYLHDIYMIFTWYLYDFIWYYMIFIWYLYDIYMIFIWYLHYIYMIFTWYLHDVYMIFIWYLHDCWILLDMFHVFSMRWQPTPLQLHTQSQPQVATQNFWRNCHKNPHSNQHQ